MQELVLVEVLDIFEQLGQHCFLDSKGCYADNQDIEAKSDSVVLYSLVRRI